MVKVGFLAIGTESRALIYTVSIDRLVEGDRADPSVVNPLGEIIQVLSTTSNRELIRKYGVWLAKQEPVAAFTVRASSVLSCHLVVQLIDLSTCS